MIISSFTPNQQGQNMLQVQFSTILPDRFHAIATSVTVMNYYNIHSLFLQMNLLEHVLSLEQDVSSPNFKVIFAESLWVRLCFNNSLGCDHLLLVQCKEDTM
jgi:hypothetical protein